MPKKLLIATDNFLPRWDGIARFLNEILPFLAVDFEVTVIAPRFRGKKGEEDYVVYRVPTHLFRVGDFNPPKFKPFMIKKIVRQHDIIWSQTIGPIGGTAIYYGRKYNKEVISYVHSIEWELVAESLGKGNIVRSTAIGLTKKIARWLYRKCDLILVPSREVKDVLEGEGISVPKKVLHLGVNTTYFVPSKNKVEAKERLGWNKDKVYIGFHGRIGREKDLPTLHEAFLKVHAAYPNTELVVIGTGVPNVMSLFNHPHEHLLGSIDQVAPYLQALDIYVLPSLTETTSLSTMEAMSCGTAVITTPVGYIKKYILPGHNGYFFEKGDVEDLAKKIEGLVRNEELREFIGKNARRTIVNYYRWSETVRKVRETFQSV